MSAQTGSVLFDAPGPKARSRYRLVAIVGGVLVAAFIAFVLYQLGTHGNLDADKWTPFLTAEIWQYYLIPGLLNTLKAAAISIVLAGLFGLVFGIGRLSQIAVVRWFCTVVVEFFRSVPVLVMMIAAFSYYSYNNIFVSDLNPLAAVVTGLTLYNGSVVAELLRSGVGSLPKGQSEAGLSIGLTPGQTLRTIQLPQAITAMLPALVGQLVVVLKDTALGQIITYPELLNTYQQIGSYKSNPVPAIIVIAVIFIVINYSLTTVAARVEGRLRRRGRSTIGAGGGGVDLVVADPELTEADQPGEDLFSDARRGT
jgi:glutamate transport system permease protein